MQKKQNNKAPTTMLSEDDRLLFQQAVRDIQPLSQNKTTPKKANPNIDPTQAKKSKTKIKKQNQAPSSIESESLLFQQAVKDIKPLHNDTVTHKIRPSNKQLQHDAEKHPPVIDTLSDEAEVAPIQPTDTLSYQDIGIQKRVFKKLRRGQYIIIDEIDLHGLNLQQAKSLLINFLEEALQVEGSCVRIIHGKGHRSANKEPVLKRQTNHWLQQHPRVLAFHSAQAKDGGTGAVYVLLRRSKLAK